MLDWHAHIFKINIYSRRTGRPQCRVQIQGAKIDAIVNPQKVLHEKAFFVPLGIPITLAPARFASCPATDPTVPKAAEVTTVSPVITPPCCTSVA